MPKKKPSARSANAVDQIIAQRLKARRLALGLSQQELARQTGITFQQIQKYENATNRIAASRLYAFAEVLDVPVAHFFQPVTETANPAASKKKAPPVPASPRSRQRRSVAVALD